MEKRITLAVAIALVTGGLSFSGDTLADKGKKLIPKKLLCRSLGHTAEQSRALRHVCATCPLFCLPGGTIARVAWFHRETEDVRHKTTVMGWSPLRPGARPQTSPALMPLFR